MYRGGAGVGVGGWVGCGWVGGQGWCGVGECGIQLAIDMKPYLVSSMLIKLLYIAILLHY